MTLTDVLAQVFPTGTVSYVTPTGGFEINGLAAGTVPQVDAVLASGSDPHRRPDERREHYLVRAHGWVLFFRICSADASSGYAEFATGRQSASALEDSDGPAVDRLIDQAHAFIQNLNLRG
jgi:hypothetical protein